MREEQPRLRAEGKRVGIGLVCYVEGTGIGPYEGARVKVQASGKVTWLPASARRARATSPALRRSSADQLGVAVRDVDVVTGDTDQFYWGAGTFASRGAVVAGNAVNEAAKVVREKILQAGRRALRSAPRTTWSSMTARCPVRRRARAARQAGRAGASSANPLRGAVKPGTEPGLEATAYFGPPSGATASGVHAMIVEVDPETLMWKSSSMSWSTTAARSSTR